MSGKSNKYDGLLEAAQNRKPDYSKAQARPEVGVSIQVGIGQDNNLDGDTKAAEELALIEDNMVEGGVYIEAPFDDCDY